jgi:hypothetical protein
MKNSLDPLPSITWTNRTPKQEQLVEAVAEREALMKLASLLDALIERKAMLLDALEAMQTSVTHSDRHFTGIGNIIKVNKEFQEHYAWLDANLDETNLHLDAALTHLQTLYGKAYYLK